MSLFILVFITSLSSFHLIVENVFSSFLVCTINRGQGTYLIMLALIDLIGLCHATDFYLSIADYHSVLINPLCSICPLLITNQRY